MCVAYLINQYPKVSHTFIRREILALERLGVKVVRFGLRTNNEVLVDSEDRCERDRTMYVLGDGAKPLLLAAINMLLTNPLRLVRAFTVAWRMGQRSERPRLVHLAYLVEACRLAAWLRTAGAEHLHAHFGTNSAEVAMLTHVLGGPRWSFTVHGSELANNPLFIGLAEKVRRCTFVAAISSHGRAQLFRFVEHDQWHKVQVVHCGLESAFYAETSNRLPIARRLICVGRLSEEKGQLLLIEAVANLALQGEVFDLVIAGDGSMRATIEAQVKHHGLQDRVRITGWISSSQVREEILDSQLLVLPSFAEGIPVVLMEAMALCRPVIATSVGGIPELVRHSQDGWLVPAGDVKALEHAIRSALNTPAEHLEQMGKAAHKRVLERHNADVAAGQLAKLIQTTSS